MKQLRTLILHTTVLFSLGNICLFAQDAQQKDIDSTNNSKMTFLIKSYKNLSLEDTKEKAKIGNDTAQLYLGSRYYIGDGVNKDLYQSFLWLKKSAEQGNDSAQILTADMYQNGEGTNIDLKQAIIWYNKAAEKGNSLAQCNLGMIYLRNNTDPYYNKSEGMKWLKKAAESGVPSFQGLYGNMLLFVENDKEEGQKWLTIAAEANDIQSQLFLGYYYFSGEYFSKNMKLCAFWIKKAKDQGSVDAENLWKELELWKLK